MTTETNQRTYWNVSFSHDFATITTRVAALNADDAIVLAMNLITDYYDLDVSRWWSDTDDTTEPAGPEFGNETACDNCGDEWANLDHDELCPECAEVKAKADNQ